MRSLWTRCVLGLVKLVDFTHNESTKSTILCSSWLSLSRLTTNKLRFFYHKIHNQIAQINSSGISFLHTFHLAYYYNYIYINKGFGEAAL